MRFRSLHSVISSVICGLNEHKFSTYLVCPVQQLSLTYRSVLLQVLASNKSFPLPVRIFEVGDVVVLDDRTEVGARNIR